MPQRTNAEVAQNAVEEFVGYEVTRTVNPSPGKVPETRTVPAPSTSREVAEEEELAPLSPPDERTKQRIIKEIIEEEKQWRRDEIEEQAEERIREIVALREFNDAKEREKRERFRNTPIERHQILDTVIDSIKRNSGNFSAIPKRLQAFEYPILFARVSKKTVETLQEAFSIGNDQPEKLSLYASQLIADYVSRSHGEELKAATRRYDTNGASTVESQSKILALSKVIVGISTNVEQASKILTLWVSEYRCLRERLHVAQREYLEST